MQPPPGCPALLQMAAGESLGGLWQTPSEFLASLLSSDVPFSIQGFPASSAKRVRYLRWHVSITARAGFRTFSNWICQPPLRNGAEVESLDVACGVRWAGARETVSEVTVCFPRA